ncbi:ORC-CDC6 family AAA ATPase [Paracoccus mutanolyticus]
MVISGAGPNLNSGLCTLKIAAQITAYKTMVTVYNTRIESPHDYQEINLSDYNQSEMANQRLSDEAASGELWIALGPSELR